MFANPQEIEPKNANAEFRDYVEVELSVDRRDMAPVSHSYAPEHLHVAEYFSGEEFTLQLEAEAP